MVTNRNLSVVHVDDIGLVGGGDGVLCWVKSSEFYL